MDADSLVLNANRERTTIRLAGGWRADGGGPGERRWRTAGEAHTAIAT
jgi:hypothetical protein